MNLILILSQGQVYIKQSTVPMVAMNHNAEPANTSLLLLQTNGAMLSLHLNWM